MTANEGFPHLGTQKVIKVTTENARESGSDSWKVDQDSLDNIRDGEYLLVKEVEGWKGHLSFEATDEASAVSSHSDEVGARVSEVEDQSMTLEIVSPAQDEDGN